MGNKILYRKIGRTVMPVASVDADDKGGNDTLAAIKQAHIAEALRAGAQMPTFEVVTTKVDGEKVTEVSRRAF